jgi:hypothetical protein
MQRPLSIGLLLVFAVALVGVYPAQWAMRSMARNEIWSNIERGTVDAARVIDLPFATTRGQVSDARFAWKEDNEFKFNGAMYDVLGRTISEGRITFHCIADKEEDALVSYAALLDPLSDLGNGISGKGHSVIKSVAKHFLGRDAALRPVTADRISSYFGMRSAMVQDGFTRPVSRPPWA